ncbi:MAG: Tar ligand binding domain-containing protein, partial [Methylococcaceae bacterium]
MATQPTNIEHIVLETDSMVTKTDLKGVVTYANADYVRNTGFHESELVGRPHDLVHHPDMPSEVFKDLWTTLEMQRPWIGLIKNLRKDGSYFWVLANITPDYENGEQIGFMAVRTKASSEQIAIAEKAYKLFKAGKAKNLRIEQGDVFEHNVFTRLDFLKKFTIKNRIITVIAVLMLAIFGVGATGLHGMSKSNNRLKSVYEDRSIPMFQIANMQKLVMNNRVLITAALTLNSPEAILKNVSQVEANIEEANKLWTAYTATYITPEEKILADNLLIARKSFVGEGLKPAIAALRANNVTEAERIIVEKVRPLYPAMGEALNNLLQLQMDVTKQEYDEAQISYDNSSKFMLMLVSLGFVSAFLMGVALYRAIIRPLKQTAEFIIRGENKNTVETKNHNEITKVLDAFKVSQVKNGFQQAEAQRIANNNLRIKIGLDSVSTGVIIADQHRHIIYYNKSAETLLTKAQFDIQKELPNFNISNLIGTNIDVFHKNPSHQQKVLDELKQTISSKVSIGGRSLVVTANPVINDEGEHLGSVAEWNDRTDEVAIENEVASVVNSIAQGDFSRRINEEGKADFVLLVSQGINNLVETCSNSLSEIVTVLSALSRGDLTQKVENDYAGTFGQLKNDTNATIESLKEIVQQIQEATDQISVGSKEIAAGNNDLSQRTEKQAASLEETAASMDELTATVRNNAENAKRANTLADEASSIAGRGVEVVAQVIHTMDDIN